MCFVGLTIPLVVPPIREALQPVEAKNPPRIGEVTNRFNLGLSEQHWIPVWAHVE